MKKVKSTLSVGKRIILLSLCMTMFSVCLLYTSDAADEL